MGFAFPPLTPAVRGLLVVLTASFVAQTVAGAAGVSLFAWLALHGSPSVALAWQWATYPLVQFPGPNSVVDRALELLMIYFWLSSFEARFGARATLGLAAAATLAGAALVVPVALALPSLAASYAGAAPISWAGLGALAVTTRGRPMQWVLLPQMNVWGLAAVFLAILALQCVWAGTATPLVASIGGFGAGIAVTRWLLRPRSGPRGGAPKRPGHLRVVRGDEDARPRWMN